MTGNEYSMNSRLVTWTVSEYESNMIKDAQHNKMRVFIKFLTPLNRDFSIARSSATITNPTDLAPNGTLYLTVENQCFEDETCIVLKRTPKRLLRPGNQLVINYDEAMYWFLPSESVTARIIDFFESEVEISTGASPLSRKVPSGGIPRRIPCSPQMAKNDCPIVSIANANAKASSANIC